MLELAFNTLYHFYEIVGFYGQLYSRVRTTIFDKCIITESVLIWENAYIAGDLCVDRM
jgi:hypothetical protein